MALNITKGQAVALSKEAPNITIAQVGLGWDIPETGAAAFDLDASAMLLGRDGKARGDKDLVYYHNLASACGAVRHHGDNRTGEGEGDDETISVDLLSLPGDVEKLVVCASIHEGLRKGQNFGQIKSPYIRLVDAVSGMEILRYALSEDFSTDTAVVFGELYRYQGEWKFRAIGQGIQGLEAFIHQYGLVANA